MQTQEQQKPRSNETLQALISEGQWLSLLLNNGKKYQPLLTFLLNKKDLKDYTIHGAVKRLASGLNETQSKTSKWIEMIYNDLWELNYENPSLFNTNNQKECVVSLHADLYKTSDSFTLYMNESFSIGNTFAWQFALPKLGIYHFYVESIIHIHEKGKVKSYVTLRSGSYNAYREYLLDKLSFLDYLTLSEQHNPDKDEVDKFLKEKRWRAEITHIQSR